MDSRNAQIKAWAKANLKSKNKRTASLAKTLMNRNNYTYGGLAQETYNNVKMVGNQTHIRTYAYDKKRGQGLGVGVHLVFDKNDNLKSVKNWRQSHKKSK